MLMGDLTPSFVKDGRLSWESEGAVKGYVEECYLFQGERLAFNSCFSDGLNGKRVLDLGCGGGRTTFFLEKEGVVVVGLDISQNLIRAAKGRSPHSDFQVGDAAALPFKNDFFDGVLFSFNSLDCLYPKEGRKKETGHYVRYTES